MNEKQAEDHKTKRDEKKQVNTAITRKQKKKIHLRIVKRARLVYGVPEVF